MTSPPFKEDDNKDIISLLKGRMLNKLCRNFGIYEDICRNMIRLSKEEYHRNSHANQKTIASEIRSLVDSMTVDELHFY